MYEFDCFDKTYSAIVFVYIYSMGKNCRIHQIQCGAVRILSLMCWMRFGDALRR